MKVGYFPPGTIQAMMDKISNDIQLLEINDKKFRKCCWGDWRTVSVSANNVHEKFQVIVTFHYEGYLYRERQETYLGESEFSLRRLSPLAVNNRLWLRMTGKDLGSQA